MKLLNTNDAIEHVQRFSEEWEAVKNRLANRQRALLEEKEKLRKERADLVRNLKAARDQALHEVISAIKEEKRSQLRAIKENYITAQIAEVFTLTLDDKAFWEKAEARADAKIIEYQQLDEKSEQKSRGVQIHCRMVNAVMCLQKRIGVEHADKFLFFMIVMSDLDRRKISPIEALHIVVDHLRLRFKVSGALEDIILEELKRGGEHVLITDYARVILGKYLKSLGKTDSEIVFTVLSLREQVDALSDGGLEDLRALMILGRERAQSIMGFLGQLNIFLAVDNSKWERLYKKLRIFVDTQGACFQKVFNDILPEHAFTHSENNREVIIEKIQYFLSAYFDQMIKEYHPFLADKENIQRHFSKFLQQTHLYAKFEGVPLTMPPKMRALCMRAKELSLNEVETETLETINEDLAQMTKLEREWGALKSQEGFEGVQRVALSHFRARPEDGKAFLEDTYGSLTKACSESSGIKKAQAALADNNVAMGEIETAEAALQKKEKELEAQSKNVLELLKKQVLCACLRYHAANKNSLLHRQVGADNALNLLRALYVPHLSLQQALKEMMGFLKKENNLNNSSFTTFLLMQLFDEKSGLLQICKIEGNATVAPLESADRLIHKVRQAERSFMPIDIALITALSLRTLSKQDITRANMSAWSQEFLKTGGVYVPKGEKVSAIQTSDSFLFGLSGRNTFGGRIDNTRVQGEEEAKKALSVLARTGLSH